MHQSIVETGTKICETSAKLLIEMHRTQVAELVLPPSELLASRRRRHAPFSSWIDQSFLRERYQNIVE